MVTGTMNPELFTIYQIHIQLAATTLAPHKKGKPKRTVKI